MIFKKYMNTIHIKVSFFIETWENICPNEEVGESS